MEIKELVEKFLPDFEKRFKAFKDRQDKLYELYEERYETEDDFYSESFHEALKNFVSRLCEKQRSICIRNYSVALLNNSCSSDLDAAIYEANEPDIEEL